MERTGGKIGEFFANSLSSSPKNQSSSSSSRPKTTRPKVAFPNANPYPVAQVSCIVGRR